MSNDSTRRVKNASILTATAVEKAKPADKAYSLNDGQGRGLYLRVSTTGAKSWRMNYRHLGQQRTLSYGEFPIITLAEARRLNDEARRLIASGVDPVAKKKADMQAAQREALNTFNAVADDWLKVRAPTWSKGHETKTCQLLKRDILPILGMMPIVSITAADVLAMARKVEARGLIEMPRRAISTSSLVFDFAIGMGLIQSNPCRGMTGQLNPRPPQQHYPHVTSDQLPDMLRGLDALDPCLGVLACKLDLLTFVRCSELLNAEWSEFDRNKLLWVVPPGRMKGRQWEKSNGQPHLVPLPAQALEILDDLAEFSGSGTMLFPGHGTGKALTGAAMAKVWSRLGLKGQQSTHGLRGLASTNAYESGLFDGRVIELQLSHKDRNKVRAAYNHSTLMDERRRLLQWWADRLDALKCENVVPLAHAA